MTCSRVEASTREPALPRLGRHLALGDGTVYTRPTDDPIRDGVVLIQEGGRDLIEDCLPVLGGGPDLCLNIPFPVWTDLRYGTRRLPS